MLSPGQYIITSIWPQVSVATRETLPILISRFRHQLHRRTSRAIAGRTARCRYASSAASCVFCATARLSCIQRPFKIQMLKLRHTVRRFSRPPLSTPMCIIESESHNLYTTYVKRAVCKAHFKMNRAFKVIQGHPYWCRQESRMVCYRYVQLMPTSFLKLTKIRQRENGKFVDFNDLTQVWRRPSNKRLRISTNDLCRQKLELLIYIFVADSMGLRWLVFT